MAGRPRTFNEATAVSTAAAVFWHKGYAETSTDELISAMQIQRGSFYNTFGSKRELFIKSINFHEETAFAEFKKMLKGSKDQIDTLKSMFLQMADCGDKAEIDNGCFAGNTLAALAGIDKELADNARSHLKKLESILFGVISRAQKAGRIMNKTDPKLLARFYLNMWNGLNITRRIYPDKQTLSPLISLQLELLA